MPILGLVASKISRYPDLDPSGYPDPGKHLDSDRCPDPSKYPDTGGYPDPTLCPQKNRTLLGAIVELAHKPEVFTPKRVHTL